ncbi:MAG: right-handed parallel beta-helix repeat-containing protein [Lachnospiraceae bacterium]|nr:right-handed parallel beta-helix repeat-containing protein [Lachnospiraceae bacterium]
MEYYVNMNALPDGDGSKEKPFLRIQQAADLAKPGDEIIVAPGIYREEVNPVNGGTEDARIIYRSEIEKEAVITGAEPVKSWEPYEGTVWVARISNKFFGGRNPYKTLIYGDWFEAATIAHTGEVYLNEKSMYEVEQLQKVLQPEMSKTSWDPEFSVYTWFTKQDEEKDETILYANFQGKNPNRENVEISVRKSCFYPEREGIGYITLSGFTVRQAATQWAPPTACQEGMIGPHWSKGWIIENCEVYEAKCSGISLGKYLQPENDNKWSKWKYKDGTQTQRDCVCQAQREGWSREKTGSHIIRGCNIHDCGQTGIVGHLGAVFSVIEDNEIHHINNKQNLFGAEIGGIKLHAAIDVSIRRNHIYNCTRGLWLDWQAQGTRVTQNLFFDNCLPEDYNLSPENVFGEDIFIEVSHGPTLIDHNLLLSDCSLKLPTQGVAVVHNLIAGSLSAVGRGVMNGTVSKVAPRYTPYHVPHSTEIAGFMTILHGDMRFCNNIFVQKEIRPALKKMTDAMADNEWTDGNLIAGTIPYEEYPTLEEYKKKFEGYCGQGSAPSDRYYDELPVWAEGNVYFNGAKPMSKENAYVDEVHQVELSLEKREGKYFLKTNLYEYLPEVENRIITTDILGMAFEPEQKFENPDGTPLFMDTDYYGRACGDNPLAGPLADASKFEL